MDRIKLEGMEFSGCHGCLPVEKEVAQRFLVDVSLSFSLLTAGKEDDPAATVDYAPTATIDMGMLMSKVCPHRGHFPRAKRRGGLPLISAEINPSLWNWKARLVRSWSNTACSRSSPRAQNAQRGPSRKVLLERLRA